MKIIKAAAASALLCSSILSTPTWADTIPNPNADAASSLTLDAMQTQCNALALARDTDGVGTGDRWSAAPVAGLASLITGPTEVASTRVKIMSSVQHAGTYVPSVLEIRGNPFRIGGSVNMFGDQWSTAGYWTDSTYDFTADFDSTFAHAFECEISQEVYHPAYVIAAVPVQGFYEVKPDARGNEEAHTNSCNAYTAIGPTWPNWGEDHAQCRFVQTEAAKPEQRIAERWDDPAVVATEAGTPVNQDQTDTLTAFEDSGGAVQVTGEYYVGQAVICNSPGSKGGSWRAQNDYSGGSYTGGNVTPPLPGCNTPYFKVAPWGGGSQTSNGTYTSVPNYSY